MTLQITIKQLAYFISAAELSSVSGAARALNVSQPSISTAINQLEDSLQQTLFVRQQGQRIILTAAGKFALTEARILQRQFKDFCLDTINFDGALQGELHISGFQDLAPYYLPGILAEFKSANAAVQISLDEGDQSQVLQNLLNCKTDIAICYHLGKEPKIIQHRLTALYPYVMLASDHRLATEKSLSLVQLVAEPLIVENLPRTKEYFMSLFRQFNLEPNIYLETSSFEMQRGLVASGLGVALSCTRPKGDLSYDGSRLICIPLNDDVAAETVVLCHLAELKTTKLMREFISCAEQYFA